MTRALALEASTTAARPYAAFADVYDRTVGMPTFLVLRDIFERLARRYGIGFRSAADLGCGTGLFARHLCTSRGVPVIAVDRSPEMLRHARNHCRGLAVRVLRQDIRELALPHPVDLVTANFDTLNHVVDERDVRAVLRRVFDNLRPGGHFLFDFITPADPLGPSARFAARWRAPASDVRQIITWHPAAQRLVVTVIRRAPCEAPLIERQSVRAHSPVEVARWLADAGFVLRGVHDIATLEHADERSASQQAGGDFQGVPAILHEALTKGGECCMIDGEAYDSC